MSTPICTHCDNRRYLTGPGNEGKPCPECSICGRCGYAYRDLIHIGKNTNAAYWLHHPEAHRFVSRQVPQQFTGSGNQMFNKPETAVCCECAHVFDAERAQHVIDDGVYCPQHRKPYDGVDSYGTPYRKMFVGGDGTVSISNVSVAALDAYFAKRIAIEGWRKPLRKPAR